MTSIIYPTLDLFLYDLRNSLGDTQDEIQKNRDLFAQKIPPYIRSELLADSDEDIDVEYVYLFDKHYLPLKSSQDCFDGYYYPVRLGDSYGLTIECTLKDITVAKSPDCFQTLKAEIEQNLQQKVATIGQTWVISGYLPEPNQSPEDIEKLAKDCYEYLMPNLSWEQELDGKGSFLGGTIFELSRQRLAQGKALIKDQLLDIITQNHHVIIILYPDQSSLDLSAKFYADWMRLLYYHHKMTWAYAQSQILTKSIKNDFTQILSGSETISQKLSQKNRLDQLRLTLEKIRNNLNQYTLKLNIIDIQKVALEINLENYQKRLETMVKKAKDKNQQTDLIFLEEFSQLVNKKYLRQIEKNLENLEKGFKLLENTINTVRTEVEVEKAQHDRAFQELVSVVGAGFVIASLVKSPEDECKAIFKVVTSHPHVIPKPPLICTIPMLYSLIIALIAGGLTWLLRKFIIK